MIIAVDYDGTLERDGKPNTQLIDRLKIAQAQGHVVILWTCRCGKSLSAALDTLSRSGFRPNFVNRNPPEVCRMLGYDPRKIFADLYIDDKAVRP